jgi:tetratricopeptide (TPR) repeat protein
VQRFDLFVSYRRSDAPRVEPLVAALRALDVRVWIDRGEIDDFAPVTEEIRNALAASKALLAWYSADYPRSRPCQIELTAAFIAAQKEGDPRRRVLVVNPEDSAAHIQPVVLRDEQHPAVPRSTEDYAALAQSIAARVQELGGALGAIVPFAPPPQYGLKLAGASRFVGRAPDLWRVHSALHGGESVIITGAAAAGFAQLSGLGGVGKSLLAEEYALRFAAAFPGGVFWLRALGNEAEGSVSAEQQESQRGDQFRALAVALGIQIEGRKAAEIEAAMHRKLGDARKPFLWVVDDLASGLSADAVRAWLAPHPLGKTLLTTRSREYDAIGEQVRLDVMRPEEAYALFCAHVRPRVEAEQVAAKELVKDLGYHPLAVEVAAAALRIRAGRQTIAEFRASFADLSRDELEFAAELAPMLPTGHDKSVAATLLRSVDMLGEEGRELLDLASALAAAPIPPRFIAAAMARLGDIDMTPAGDRCDKSMAQAFRQSLAESDAVGAVTVHALVSRTVRFRQSAAARSKMRTAVVRVLNAVLPHVVDIRTHSALSLEVLHARSLCSGLLADTDSSTLASWVARHDYERGAYDVSRNLYEQVLRACRRLLGEEHPDTLTAMNNLAQTVKAQGDLGTLYAQGDLAGARGLQEQVLEVSHRLLGEEHPDTLRAMGNLAGTLKAQGDLAGARGLEEQVLEVRRRLLGEVHPDTLTAMNNLAQTLKALGDHLGARGLEEQVLEVRRRILGEEHPDTLKAMGNLAGTLYAQGDLAGARGLEEQVLGIFRRILGEAHPDTLTAMGNLAGTLSAQGDLAGARGLEEQVLKVFRRLLGEEHPDTTIAAWNLFGTMVQAQEPKAYEFASRNLGWLLDRDAATLSGAQRQIRDQLIRLMQAANAQNTKRD